MPDSELWFLENRKSAISERFRARLLTVCRDIGIEPDRIVFREHLGQGEFLALNAATDVALDGIGWSGCNTLFEAFAMGLPIVTWPGNFMRSRHCFAMFRMMKFTDAVASSADQYVEIAAKLGQDRDWRSHMRDTRRERSHLIFDDQAPNRGLEAFLLEVAGRTGDAGLPARPGPDPQAGS